tara:strand:- start:146 stop:460 length:315 start_codon:yes stop_codon:yes gene_type:complete
MANRLIGLAVILLVALLPVAQGIAATSFEVKPMVEASVMLPDTQALHDCARLNAQGSCNSPCSTAHVGKSALTDSVLLLSSFCPKGYSSHFGRVLSGPDPFPPK